MKQIGLLLALIQLVATAGYMGSVSHEENLDVANSGHGNSTESVAEHPYQIILDRNVFGLRDPVAIPPPDPDKVLIVERKTVKLNGLTSVLSQPKAILTVETPAKQTGPRRSASAESFGLILTVGENSHGLTLLDMDLEQGTATVEFEDQVTHLNLLANAMAP